MPMYVTSPKIRFDVANTDHLKIYNKYLKTKRWSDGCPFTLEWPYANIPVMIERKIIDYYIDELIMNVRSAEMAKTIKHPKK